MLDLLGKEFEYNGRGPETYDCYGLAMEVLKRRGITLPDIHSETEASLIHQQVVFTQCNPIFRQLHKAKKFCIVTFKIQPPFTSHVGVVLEDCRRFIHIMQKRQVCIERLDAPEWSRRVTGYYEVN